jgi:hypothetical protein
MAIKADIIEQAAQKPRQDCAVGSDRNSAERPDELDAVTFPEAVDWLCHILINVVFASNGAKQSAWLG